MNNIIKQQVRQVFDREINEDYLRGASTGAQLSGIKRFIDGVVDRVRITTIQECVDALPKWKQLYMAPDGWNEYKDEARTTLLALKNKNIDV